MSLQALLHPKSVAIVGASQNPQKVGGVPIRLLSQLGYAGRIDPINPAAKEVQGLRAYASLADTPEPAELAIIAVPAPAVELALRDAARAGVRAAIVLSSGFAEVGGEGVAMQQRLVEIARDGGLTLLGPNCLGAMNLRERLFATFSPAPLAGLPQPGGVAIVSQSGAFGAYAYSLARAGGLGLSHWVTTGNEAALSVSDVIDGLVDDPDTRVILAYVEGARDGQALQRALRRARLAGKPVIVTKVGRTEAGARAAMSHTASLSGEDSVYQAVFDDTGTVRAATVAQMFRLGLAFSLGHLPRGRRVGIITISGGVGTLMADAASDAGLAMPPLPEFVCRELLARVPFCSPTNPVDVTGQAASEFGVLDYAAVEAARSGCYDSVVLFLAAAGAAPGYAEKIARMVSLVRAAAPRITLALAGIVTPELKSALLGLGCMVFEEPTHAIDAIAQMARWQAHQTDPDPVGACTAVLPSPAGLLNEAEGLAFLAAQGIPVAAHRHVQDAAEAAAAWGAICGDDPGAAAVLKIVSRDLLHKSDVGGVRLGLRDAAELHAAALAIDAAVTQHAPQARREGLLVARQLRPRVEVMLGARHDASFGTLVVLGLGGVGVEMDPRTAVLTAPTTPQRVRQRLDELGILRRLAPWRGQPQVDPQPLIDTVVRFAALAAGIGARLRTMEINPLMVTDTLVAAADAVIEIEAA